MKYSKIMMLVQKAIESSSEVKIDFCMSSEFARQIELWTRMFENHPPWKHGEADTIQLPATIAGEVARLVTLELETEVTGSSRATFLNESYQSVIKHIRRHTEYGCAKGGLIFKPYPSLDKISVQIIQADCFFPISFDDTGRITECVFLEQFRRGNKVYSRLEIHKLQNHILTIANEVYLSTNDYSLGSKISISAVDKWAMLVESVSFSGVERLPFGYFRVPLANAFDSDSPLGVSVYSRAVDLIRDADKRYNQINWEYESKEAAIHVAESLLKQNHATGEPELPKGKERLYRYFDYNAGVTDKPFLEEFSPDIRDESLYNGLNKQFRLIEWSCGLAYGTLSDPNNVDKTAEEIRSSKQRSYQMISDTQGALQDALEDLVCAMDFYCSVYELVPSGVYKTSFVWDDSIVVDTDAEQTRNIALVQAGLRSKIKAIMEINRCTEEEAKEELERIAQDGQITGQDIDWTQTDGNKQGDSKQDGEDEE